MDKWTVLWIVWLALFLMIEIPAVLDKTPGNTFSEHLWKWASMKDKGTAWRVRRLILLIVLIWLIAHLLTGGKF